MILPAPNAPDGTVGTLGCYNTTDFHDGSAVLCRNTAPLISLAFGFIRRGRGARILGKEIGQNLARSVKQTKASCLEELSQKIVANGQRDAERLRRRNAHAQAAGVDDRTACLTELCANSDSISSLLSQIERLFSDNGSALLTLATVHKAKGLEWDHVFILDRDLMPSRWATLPWQKVQERNIQYVAVTRARLTLTYVKSNCWV